jgi:hypothetical protein
VTHFYGEDALVPLTERNYDVSRDCQHINCDNHGCNECARQDTGYEGCFDCSMGGYCMFKRNGAAKPFESRAEFDEFMEGI